MKNAGPVIFTNNIIKHYNKFQNAINDRIDEKIEYNRFDKWANYFQGQEKKISCIF